MIYHDFLAELITNSIVTVTDVIYRSYFAQFTQLWLFNQSSTNEVFLTFTQIAQLRNGITPPCLHNLDNIYYVGIRKEISPTADVPFNWSFELQLN